MVDQVNSVKGSNARLSWTDDELVIEHGRISRHVVGQLGARVPWTQVLGARPVGKGGQYVQVDVDGHTPPESIVQDLWSFCARPKERTKLIEVISARAACRTRTPDEPVPVVEVEQPRAAPAAAAAPEDPEIARLRERSAKWARRVAWTTDLELLLVLLPVAFGFLVFVVIVVVAAFLLL